MKAVQSEMIPWRLCGVDCEYPRGFWRGPFVGVGNRLAVMVG